MLWQQPFAAKAAAEVSAMAVVAQILISADFMMIPQVSYGKWRACH